MCQVSTVCVQAWVGLGEHGLDVLLLCEHVSFVVVLGGGWFAVLWAC